MSDDRFQVSFSGLVQGTDEDTARLVIRERFQVPANVIDSWFTQPKATIKDDLSKDQAWKLQQIFESLGVKTTIVPQTRSNLQLDHLQLQAFAGQSGSVASFASAAHFAPRPSYQAGRTPQAKVSRNRSTAQKRPGGRSEQAQHKSLKLSHIAMIALTVMALSYAGKQFLYGSNSIYQPVAQLSEQLSE
ncbi:MAG: hypothetical protein MI976_03555 [Pseudomonadales bacterium]|nr:hypothetical protein [Pseudomonadales bacterium]